MAHRNTFYHDQASNVAGVRDDDLGLTHYTYDLLSRLSWGQDNLPRVANDAATQAGSLPHRWNTATANVIRPGARAAARSIA